MEKTYYVSQGGPIPIKWTAPEVILIAYQYVHNVISNHYRHFTTASIQHTVIFGALV